MSFHKLVRNNFEGSEVERRGAKGRMGVGERREEERKKRENLPVEVQDQFMEASGQKVEVPLSPWCNHLEHSEHCPCVDRGVHVTKLELIGWDLSIGSHVPFSEEEDELILGKLRVHLRKGDHVEGQVPGSILD